MLAVMRELGVKARAAARSLALSPTDQRNAALIAMAKAIRNDSKIIFAANSRDLEAARQKDLKSSFIDRLTLTPARIEAMAGGLEDIAALPDPVGKSAGEMDQAQWHGNLARCCAHRCDRHHLRKPPECDGRCRGPVPEVRQRCHPARVAQTASSPRQPFPTVCNADSRKQGLTPTPYKWCRRQIARLSATCSRVSMATSISLCRAVARVWLRACSPMRACPCSATSKASAMSMSTSDADLDMANSIVLNAKMRRTGVCGSAETILVDKAIATQALPLLISTLIDAGLRSSRRRFHRQGRCPRESRQPKRIGTRNISTPLSPCAWWMALHTRWTISPNMARNTRTPL